MNPKRILAIAACFLAVLAFAGPDSSAQTTPAPVPPATPGAPHHGRHPALRAAITALERAKADMQAAAHDFGGHRVEAIAACDAAIAQLRLALQYANGNSPSGERPPPPSSQ